jgi:SWI/SNF-related matrix-associated actin-dependent regulator 1 of chromatin subfamily A
MEYRADQRRFSRIALFIDWRTVLKLYKYQEKGVRWITHFSGRALLADEMGLGKTIQALEWVRRNPAARPALVVCPAHLKWVWESEAAKVGLLSNVISGGKVRRGGIDLSIPFTIINYDILEKWKDELKFQRYRTLIVDEVHFAKNNRAKRTKALKEVSKNIPHVIAISGTPLLNRPYELWGALNLVRPDLFPSLYTYAHRYCKPVRKFWGWEYKGAEHMDELHDMMKKNMLIRRRKKEVLKELPDKTRNVVLLDVNLKEYKEADTNFLEWLKSISEEKSKRAATAAAIAKMGYLKRLAATLKFEMIQKWIESHLENTDEKLVVYGIHRNIVRALHDLWPKQSVIIDGRVKGHSKKMAERSFQTKDNIRLFFGNIQAAGTGLTLTKASHLVFAELDWVPSNHTQAEDRIHRIGQRNPAIITYLVAKGTIEESLCELIQRKYRIVLDVMDGKKADRDFNVHDKLIESMMNRIGDE